MDNIPIDNQLTNQQGDISPTKAKQKEEHIKIAVFLRPEQIAWIDQEKIRRLSEERKKASRSQIVREALDACFVVSEKK